MKKFFKEFKEFALRGNMFDLACGIIIGAAFTKLVTAFSNNLLLPLIKFVSGTRYTKQELFDFLYNFINTFFELILTSFVLFIIVKIVNRARKKKPSVATTKECLYCKSKIHKDALKCPHCASLLAESINTEKYKET